MGPSFFLGFLALKHSNVSPIPPGLGPEPKRAAADWLVHCTTITDKHYRQTTEAHFAKAVGIDPESAAQKAAQSDAVTAPKAM